MLRDNAIEISCNPQNDENQRELVSIIYKLLIKNQKDVALKQLLIHHSIKN